VTRRDGGCEAVVKVSNTGRRDGATVVQLYLGLRRNRSQGQRGNSRASSVLVLKAGESRSVRITVPDELVRYWSPAEHRWTMPVGPVRLDIGFSEREISQTATLPSMGTNQPRFPSHDEIVTLFRSWACTEGPSVVSLTLSCIIWQTFFP